MIEFGREICGDAENALRREWLVTNGTGSYACGTVAGANTRCYHGVLIAALSYLRPFAHHLIDLGLGSISEVFDGDTPHLPRGCVSQAWSVAEVLHLWVKLNNEK